MEGPRDAARRRTTLVAEPDSCVDPSVKRRASTNVEASAIDAVTAALRAAEAVSIDTMGRLAPPFLVHVDTDAIRIHHDNDFPRLLMKRRPGGVFDLHHYAGRDWSLLAPSLSLEAILARWADERGRWSDLNLRPRKPESAPKPDPRPAPKEEPASEPRPAWNKKIVDPATWRAKPTEGYVKIDGMRALARGAVLLTWNGAAKPTTALKAAARRVMESDEADWAEVLDALYADSVHHAFGGRPDFAGPAEVLRLVALAEMQLATEERDGVAYVTLVFNPAWRGDARIAVSVHPYPQGIRVVAVGSWPGLEPDDDDGAHLAPPRDEDGALAGEDWIEEPCDTLVAFGLPGLRGPTRVAFVYDGPLTKAQRAAARALVERSEEIASAIARALDEAAASGKGKAGKRGPNVLRHVRVHAEENEKVAYVEATLDVPWRASPRAVVLHGARVVAVTAASPAMRRGETRLKSIHVRGKKGGPAMLAIEADQAAPRARTKRSSR